MVETQADEILKGAESADVTVAFLVVGDPYGYASPRAVSPPQPTDLIAC